MAVNYAAELVTFGSNSNSAISEIPLADAFPELWFS